jgi:hypothetical protein
MILRHVVTGSFRVVAAVTDRGECPLVDFLEALDGDLAPVRGVNGGDYEDREVICLAFREGVRGCLLVEKHPCLHGGTFIVWLKKGNFQPADLARRLGTSPVTSPRCRGDVTQLSSRWSNLHALQMLAI